MMQEPDEYSFWWPEGVQPRPIVTGPVQGPQSGHLTRSAMVAATVAAVAGSAFFGPALGAAVAQTPSKAPNANSSSPTTVNNTTTPASAATGVGGGGQGIDYEVQTGDTLYSIAQQHGVSTLSVIAANDFANPDLILPGQHVTIPTDGNGSTPSDVTITVADGDTVGNLADHYGVSAASIVIANSLANPNLIVVGQSLVIPGGGGSSASADTSTTASYASTGDAATTDSGSSTASTANDVTVTVKDGDTINKLANQYGVSAASIISANSLSNPNVIVVGQSLTIPGGAAANTSPAVGSGGQGGQNATAQPQTAGNTAPVATEASAPPATPAPTATPEPTPAPTPPPAPAPAATQGFVWPVQGTITQNFGPTSLGLEPAYEGYAHFHQGLDIANSMYTPIHAAGAGTVIFAGWSNSGYGFCVKIDHGNGLVTLYGHMAQQPSVSVGESVGAGDLIGKMGSTGASTGPHTHFAVLKDGVWVNPLNYLP